MFEVVGKAYLVVHTFEDKKHKLNHWQDHHMAFAAGQRTGIRPEQVVSLVIIIVPMDSTHIAWVLSETWTLASTDVVDRSGISAAYSRSLFSCLLGLVFSQTFLQVGRVFDFGFLRCTSSWTTGSRITSSRSTLRFRLGELAYYSLVMTTHNIFWNPFHAEYFNV